MRNSVYKAVLEELSAGLTVLKGNEIGASSNKFIKIMNWNVIGERLHKLNEFPFMKESVEKVFELGFQLRTVSKDMSIELAKYNELERRVNNVSLVCESIITFLNTIDRENEDVDSNIYIKIPESISFDEYSEIIKGLNKVLSQCPVLEEFRDAKFKRVEQGSSIIVISIVAGMISKNVGYIADTLKKLAEFIKVCIEIKGEILNNQRTKKEIELIDAQIGNIRDEKYEEIYRARKEIIEKNERELILSTTKGLVDNLGKPISPEEESKIILTVNIMVDLLDKGVEVYPSTKVSAEIKQVFPHKEEYKQIETETKMLDEQK